MTKPRVFVVQDQRVHSRGSLVSKFNLTPAEVFGTIEYVLPPDAKPFAAQHVIDQVHQKLKTFTSKDYILLVGNPVLIGWVFAIAAHYSGGVIRCLQWEQSKQSYIPISAELFAYS